MDKLIIKYPEAGDLFDPRDMYPESEALLILPGFESWDQGLEVNRREGHNFWKPGEVIQFRGVVNGVMVWIEMVSGRLGLNGKTGYRVAFGDHPEYPPMINVDEAARLIRENVPPTEYVRVTPEEWAARREGDNVR